jgi:hypothetical protein
MTPKERWLAVLNGEKPDRLPLDYWATPEATANLAALLADNSRSTLSCVSDFRSLPPWGGWASGGGWKTGGAWSEAERFIFEQLSIDAVVAVQPAYSQCTERRSSLDDSAVFAASFQNR